MKKILFLMAMTLGIISCGQNSKVEDRNASTQNPLLTTSGGLEHAQVLHGT